MKNKLMIRYVETKTLVAYARNSRTHSNEQIAQIVASMKEFGFTNPILLDDSGTIIAGHARVVAAMELKLDKVPTITLHGLTDEQRRAYVIADNAIALNAGWNIEMLKLEINELSAAGFDLDAFGIGDEFLQDIIGKLNPSSPYSRKIEAPVYEVMGEKPTVSELFDDSKTRRLISDIEATDLPDIEKDFLIAAAHRHTVFDFGKIAEYYANADMELQRQFEESALVLIDFQKAIEQGYVNICEAIRQSFIKDTADK